MGSRAVRITRKELLTPPEFRGLDPVQHQAARVGGARIELTRVGGETRLGTCYQQVPVRVMPPFVLSTETASFLYLINLTAGLMDGDGHLVQVTARSGTRRGDGPIGHPDSSGRGELRDPAVDRRGRGRCVFGDPARTYDPVPRQPLLSRGRVELAPTDCCGAISGWPVATTAVSYRSGSSSSGSSRISRPVAPAN